MPERKVLSCPDWQILLISMDELCRRVETEQSATV